ncbi:hypothetical protein [Streptomyces sclerotialus]|uniref:hypothetical protein n=1 Tax=Streptomyces sclerotialus TaxID=1957 RepID=UPI000AF86F65
MYQSRSASRSAARTAARPAARTAARSAARPAARSRSGVPFGAADADVLRVISDSRTPVFLTVHAGGRRRYGYWQPYDSSTNTGGCYVALPTAVCDRLHSVGRFTFGDPLEDPAKTTYRVSLAHTPAEPARAAVAPVRIPAAPVRATAQRLAA